MGTQKIMQKLAERNPGRPMARFSVILGLKGEIQEALASGWSLHAIWGLLRSEKIFLGSYDSFRRVWAKVLDFKPTVVAAPVEQLAVKPVVNDKAAVSNKAEGRAEEEEDDGPGPIIAREPPRKPLFSFGK